MRLGTGNHLSRSLLALHQETRRATVTSPSGAGRRRRLSFSTSARTTPKTGSWSWETKLEVSNQCNVLRLKGGRKGSPNERPTSQPLTPILRSADLDSMVSALALAYTLSHDSKNPQKAVALLQTEQGTPSLNARRSSLAHHLSPRRRSLPSPRERPRSALCTHGDPPSRPAHHR